MSSITTINKPCYPSRLYHYTNLASLALILQNRTLRLMPLAGMDDPQENQTEDITNVGRFFYASCWTDESKESIPMWNMYASLDSGVRIDLPPMPFKRYEYTEEKAKRILGTIEVHFDPSSPIMRTFMPLENLRDGLCSAAFMNGTGVFQKITYTDKPELLYPKIQNSDDSRLNLTFECVGRYKNTYWEFQKEWRYLMLITPFNIFESYLHEGPAVSFAMMLDKIVAGELAPACSYYDLHLSDTAMKDIGITPSPKMNAGNRALLSCLLEKYGLTANLKPSQLQGAL